MNRIEEIRVEGYEKILSVENTAVGLKAIIAIHNTKCGPSCGGIRMLPYPSQNEALEDVLRLSKGMSYKSALANIGFGGGKSVIIGNPQNKTKEMLCAFGDFVHSLGGRYIAAKDMNIGSSDLFTIRSRTPHVLGIEGMEGSSGDPSPITARGIFQAMRATAKELNRSDVIRGMKVAIQGLGAVGFGVAKWLTDSGAEVWGADINPTAVEKAQKELGVKPVPLDSILSMECDIFSPCARGAILNEKTIPQLRCKAVVGGANNQLATVQDGNRIHECGILYAPDYAVNAGGIINIFVELSGYSEARACQKADEIYETMGTIFARARKEKLAPFVIADRLAEERMSGKN